MQEYLKNPTTLKCLKQSVVRNMSKAQARHFDFIIQESKTQPFATRIKLLKSDLRKLLSKIRVDRNAFMKGKASEYAGRYPRAVLLAKN